MVHKIGKIGIYIVRILWIALCVLTVAYIFSNSLKTGEASSAQSSTVVEIVKDCASTIAPDSKVANATGTGYQKLHAFVRRMAHFSEFALLGIALIGCYVSFTHKKRWIFTPFLILVGVACTDELLQGTVVGRVADIADVVMDVLGGLSGSMVALAVIMWLFLIRYGWVKEPERIEELSVDVVLVKRD